MKKIAAVTIFLATITPAVAGERCDSGKTIVATVSTKVIIGDVNDALQSSNPMIKNIGSGSRMCTDDSTNIVWTGQIPPGLIAVRFTIGLRSYQGFVKEVDFKEADFSDRSPPVSGGTEKASYESLLMGLISRQLHLPPEVRAQHLIAVGQIGLFVDEQPEEKNLDAFGHDIRNLLILACTEAEAHWRGVLVANGVNVQKDRYTTNDYVKLLAPMKLDEYAVMFHSYPWLPAFKPYAGWDASKPTASLKWYDSYNAAKHDRETQFKEATLRCVFEAISACVVMMAAQFGLDEGLGQGSELRSSFHLSGIPDWPLSQYYIPPFGKQPSLAHFDFNMRRAD